ncbi:hypothetical protein BGZ65_007158 [Modicella reniformis]|uniref:Uncharacterized protein n=1 Tax=Modicella reniformis TaxID=1440133 RepID=A0A9P6ILF1_9FUNG|nr:hypothetical protein BGZ65_007158 [Modicella reniformis]
MLLSLFRTTWRGAHYFCLLALLTLAFDVSKTCGLDYSLWLVSYYIINLVLKRVFSRGSLKLVAKSSKLLEPVAIVGLLFLAIFNPLESSGYRPIWEFVIKGSDPILTLLEGFGTILIIQWSSQQVRRLAGRSDGYQIAFLVLSATIYVISGFGLYHLYAASSPELVPSVRSASIIGCCMTLTVVLSIIALVSQRGVITDTAFLFAYMVMTMYIAARNEAIENGPVKNKVIPLHSAVEFVPLSAPYLQSLKWEDVERITIQALVHLSQLMQVLMRALSSNLIVSLLYRMGVLIAVSHIAPRLNIGQDPLAASSSSSSKVNGFSSKAFRNNDDNDDGMGDGGRGGVVPLLASMAKPVLLMTHTRVLLQYFGYLKPSLAIWGWLSSFLCLILFATELVLAREDAWEQYRTD